MDLRGQDLAIIRIHNGAGSDRADATGQAMDLAFAVGSAEPVEPDRITLLHDQRPSGSLSLDRCPE